MGSQACTTNKSSQLLFIDGASDIQPVKDLPKAMLEGSYINHCVAVGDQHQVILRGGGLKDHEIHPFKVYDLVVWGAFKELCDHHRDVIIGHFNQHRKKPYPH